MKRVVMFLVLSTMIVIFTVRLHILNDAYTMYKEAASVEQAL